MATVVRDPNPLGIPETAFDRQKTDLEIHEEERRRYVVLVDAYARVRRRLQRCPDYSQFVRCMEARIAAVADGRLQATAGEVAEYQAQLADARTLLSLIQEIRTHPFVLRRAPPVSRPVQREVFLEDQLARVLGPWRIENGNAPPPANKYADEFSDREFVAVQDMNIRHGPFGRWYHGAQTRTMY